MSDQLDRLESSVNEIKNLLAGDDYGREGMVAKQNRNHKRLITLENNHKKFKWVTGVWVSVLGLILIFKNEIKELFSN